MADPTSILLDARHQSFLAMLAGDEGARRRFRELNRQYVASKRPKCQVKPVSSQNPARKAPRKGLQAPIQPTLF